MAGVRNGARAVLRYYVPLLFIAVIAQILLAGEGIFGIKEGPKLDDQKTLDPHRALGFILTEPAAFLLLICALLAWLPDRRLRRLSIALPFLIFLQAPLAWAGRWSGMFHPLNAFLVLGLLGYLSRQLWRQRAEMSEQAVPAAA
ncbi:MAG: DUF6220 domain-containing protein [Gaiellaceae bacterium]